MIKPARQWAIQIDVTNQCVRQCSNCTRLLSHCNQPFIMGPSRFREACKALQDFPAKSEPDLHNRRKVVGIIGGEPLLNPWFPTLADIYCEYFAPEHRGLWTGIDWTMHKHAESVAKILGPNPTGDTSRNAREPYLNLNKHDRPCRHQPVLVAVRDVVKDEEAMWGLIDACRLQEDWSATITPKGFFFCEVAGAMDWVFRGPGGLPVTSLCWTHDLVAYRDQIERWCPRCGVCLPLKARRDIEEIDDISESNLEELRKLGSPRVLAGDYELFNASSYDLEANLEGWDPLRYLG